MKKNIKLLSDENIESSLSFDSILTKALEYVGKIKQGQQLDEKLISGKRMKLKHER
ncbi:MAG: hypothetical protein OEX17_07735 [Rhodospirillaceae bacterium]|nr:hypothetical protein [Rhodospirillaceae bacterium]